MFINGKKISRNCDVFANVSYDDAFCKISKFEYYFCKFEQCFNSVLSIKIIYFLNCNITYFSIGKMKITKWNAPTKQTRHFILNIDAFKRCEKYIYIFATLC